MFVKLAIVEFVAIDMLTDQFVDNLLFAVFCPSAADLFGTPMVFYPGFEFEPGFLTDSLSDLLSATANCKTLSKLRAISATRPIAFQLFRKRRFMLSELFLNRRLCQTKFQNWRNLVSLFKGKLLIFFHRNSLMSKSKSEELSSTYPSTATPRVALTI